MTLSESQRPLACAVVQRESRSDGLRNLRNLRYMRPHSPGALCPLNPAPTSQRYTNLSLDLVKLGST